MNTNQDLRLTRRREVKIEASLMEPGWATLQGQVKDLSLGGAFFHTGAISPAVSTQGLLVVYLGQGDEFETYRLPVEVVHLDRDGVGLRFRSVDKDILSLLKSASTETEYLH